MNTKQLIRIFSIVFLLYTLHITHYTSVVYPATKGNPPVAHWRFDEQGGPTAYDESTNNNDGTLTAGATGANTAVGQMWTRQGKIAGALECDGDDYVTASGTTGMNTTAVTFSAWIKPDTAVNAGYPGQNRVASVIGNGGLYLYND